MTVSDSKVTFSSQPLTLQDIKRVHDAAYIEILACDAPHRFPLE